MKMFAVVPPGVESLALEELQELGLHGVEEEGGVSFEGSLDDVYRVSLHARLPSRLLLRLGYARSHSLAALADGVRALGWRKYVHPGQRLDLHVSSHGKRRLRQDIIEKKVKYAIGDDLKRVRGPRRPPKEAAGVWIRTVGDRAEISVDASGEHLHRRGWATHRTEAPLRENLAAAVLRGCGWHPGLPLVDPMCGSGTLLLEAATLVGGVAAGSRRSFAFERWPCHDDAAWRKHKAAVAPLDVPGGFWGFDRDAKAVEAARSNAQRAGVSLELGVADVGDLQPPIDDVGWVITNPPYGQRIGKGREKAVLQRFGKALSERFSGWGVAVVLPGHLVRHVGVPLETVLRFRNGGIKVVVAAGVVP